MTDTQKQGILSDALDKKDFSLVQSAIDQLTETELTELRDWLSDVQMACSQVDYMTYPYEMEKPDAH